MMIGSGLCTYLANANIKCNDSLKNTYSFPSPSLHFLGLVVLGRVLGLHTVPFILLLGGHTHFLQIPHFSMTDYFFR